MEENLQPKDACGAACSLLMKGASAEVPRTMISANQGNNSLLLHLISLSGLKLCNYLGSRALAGRLHPQAGTTCSPSSHSGRASVRRDWQGRWSQVCNNMWKSTCTEASTNPWGRFIPVPLWGLSTHAERTDICLFWAGVQGTGKMLWGDIKISVVVLMVKNLPAMWRPRLDPWVGKIPWRRQWLATPVFFPGEFHGQRSLVSYSPQGHKDSDTTEWLTLSLAFHFQGILTHLGHRWPLTFVFNCIFKVGDRWSSWFSGCSFQVSRSSGDACDLFTSHEEACWGGVLDLTAESDPLWFSRVSIVFSMYSSPWDFIWRKTKGFFCLQMTRLKCC